MILFLGSDYEPQYQLTFKVNDKNVSALRNRFQQAEDQTYVADANKKLLYDYKWNVDNGERVERMVLMSLLLMLPTVLVRGEIKIFGGTVTIVTLSLSSLQK